MRFAALVIAILPSVASASPLDDEIATAVLAVREASAGDAGPRLGHALSAVRRILDRVQDLAARRKLAEARALLPELAVRVEAVRTARRVLELEDRARAKEREAIEADEDAQVAKDAYERAIEVRRELEAAP
jgi:hypothetical protein